MIIIFNHKSNQRNMVIHKQVIKEWIYLDYLAQDQVQNTSNDLRNYNNKKITL